MVLMKTEGQNLDFDSYESFTLIIYVWMYTKSFSVLTHEFSHQYRISVTLTLIKLGFLKVAFSNWSPFFQIDPPFNDVHFSYMILHYTPSS